VPSPPEGCLKAFANADGGTLLLGADNDGTLSGHGYPEESITEFLAVPQRRLRPAVPIRHQRITLDGNEIIVIQVGIEPEAVMVDGDGFPYRVGDQVRQEPQEIINQRKQAYRTVGYECRKPRSTTSILIWLGVSSQGLFIVTGLRRMHCGNWG
jgi:predicted HTH transcriptional regulator